MTTGGFREEELVQVQAGPVRLPGSLGIPRGAHGLVLFAHGSGSSRYSPRNRYVSQVLRESGIATLLMDLLTPEEEEIDSRSGHLRFDIGLLADRLAGATDWVLDQAPLQEFRVGYFGASTGGGAALVAAAERPDAVGAVVSRGGRPDLAGVSLARVKSPTLLIVGGNDMPVLRLNRQALEELGALDKELAVIPGATHLFEEPGALEEVARLAAHWFSRFLPRPRTH